MYLFETGFGQVFRPRPKYQKPQLQYVSQYWTLEVPFRKDFGAFRQELSNAIRPLVTANTDQAEIDRLLLKDKNEEQVLKDLHNQLLKRKSRPLKEADAVKIYTTISFNKADYTAIRSVDVYGL
jgi:hypothetical protein